MKFNLIAFAALLFTFTASTDAALIMENYDQETGIALLGDVQRIDRATTVSMVAEKETISNLISLVLPDGWTLYIHRAEATKTVSANFHGSWVDVVINLLEQNGITGTIDIASRRIDVDSRLK